MTGSQRTATVSINRATEVLPRGKAFGYADFLAVWGDPQVGEVSCVDDAGEVVTFDSLTEEEQNDARREAGELEIRYAFRVETPEGLERARQLLTKLGLSDSDLTPTAREKIQKAVAILYDEFRLLMDLYFRVGCPSK